MSNTMGCTVLEEDGEITVTFRDAAADGPAVPSSIQQLVTALPFNPAVAAAALAVQPAANGGTTADMRPANGGASAGVNAVSPANGGVQRGGGSVVAAAPAAAAAAGATTAAAGRDSSRRAAAAAGASVEAAQPATAADAVTGVLPVSDAATAMDSGAEADDEAPVPSPAGARGKRSKAKAQSSGAPGTELPRGTAAPVKPGHSTAAAAAAAAARLGAAPPARRGRSGGLASEALDEPPAHHSLQEAAPSAAADATADSPRSSEDSPSASAQPRAGDAAGATHSAIAQAKSAAVATPAGKLGFQGKRALLHAQGKKRRGGSDRGQANATGFPATDAVQHPPRRKPTRGTHATASDSSNAESSEAAQPAPPAKAPRQHGHQPANGKVHRGKAASSAAAAAAKSVTKAASVVSLHSEQKDMREVGPENAKARGVQKLEGLKSEGLSQKRKQPGRSAKPTTLAEARPPKLQKRLRGDGRGAGTHSQGAFAPAEVVTLSV